MRVSMVAHRVCTTMLLLWACCLGGCGTDKAGEAYTRGHQAVQQGDYRHALEYFSEAIALDSSRADAYLGRGMIRWRSNQFARALPDLNRAIELQPDLTWAYFFRGASLISLRRFDEGIADFTKVTASSDLPIDDLVRAHRWRAVALLNLERYEEAVQDYTACVALQPDEPFHRVERGRVYQELGQKEKAVADYQRYLALSRADDALTAEVKNRIAALEDAAIQ